MRRSVSILLSLWTILVKLSTMEATGDVPIHIIFILADDLGWNDVSYHGSPEIPTPNIDALAASGIKLESYYTDMMCTPSRGSLLSGRLSIHLGLQHFATVAGVPSAMPLNVATMPQYLKGQGYSTHMVGKWHIGYHRKEYTPIYRGFDSFFGFYNGIMDYYDHTHYKPADLGDPLNFYGVNLYNGTTPVFNFRGQYSTDMFTQAAENIIDNHDKSKPLFLYLAYNAVHIGNDYMPHQAPPEVIQKFGYIKNYTRRVQAAMTAKLDEGVGKIFTKLNERDMLDHSIIAFASDNGGETFKARHGCSRNYPLRGQKETLFEGGIRVPALIWSPIFQHKEPRVYNQLMHVTDWLPTLYTAAGGNVEDLQNIDGISMWDALLTNAPSPRKYIFHSADSIFGLSAIRIKNFKLVNGSSPDDTKEWYGPTGFENIKEPPSMDEWVFKNDSVVRGICQDKGWWLLQQHDTWRNQVVTCGPPPADNGGCNVNAAPCLFDIDADPCEYHNIADSNPEKVQEMMFLIRLFEAEALKPTTKMDERADPACYGFAYVPWQDPEFASQSCSHG